MVASPNTQIALYFTLRKSITTIRIGKFYLFFDLFYFKNLSYTPWI